MESPVMSQLTLQERVAALERQVGALLANHVGTSTEYPVADFYKPLEFTWTEEEYQVEEALKAYIEGNHAHR